MAYHFDSDGGDVDVYGEEMSEQEDGDTGGDMTGDSSKQMLMCLVGRVV